MSKWKDLTLAGSIILTKKQDIQPWKDAWKGQGYRVRVFERVVQADNQQHVAWVLVARRPEGD